MKPGPIVEEFFVIVLRPSGGLCRFLREKKSDRVRCFVEYEEADDVMNRRSDCERFLLRITLRSRDERSENQP